MPSVPDDPTVVLPSTELSRPPTVAQCHEVIDTLTRLVAELQQQLADQQQRLAWLHERLQLDSKNSSKPPSSDGPASGNRAQRRASGRKRGAQKGHPGSFRALLDEKQVDHIIDCPPSALCECGGVVQDDGQARRHQVFEVPLVRAQVSEYRLLSGCCTACGKRQRGQLPAGGKRSVGGVVAYDRELCKPDRVATAR